MKNKQFSFKCNLYGYKQGQAANTNTIYINQLIINLKTLRMEEKNCP